MLVGGPSFNDDHDDYYPTPRRAVAQRVASGRCVGCDAWTVDVYFCGECAVRSDYVCSRFTDDQQSSTATTISRYQQRRTDQAAAYEQLIQLQSANDPLTFTIGDDQEAPRSARIRKMALKANGNCALTPADRARIEKLLPAIIPNGIGHGITYASSTIRRANRIARRQAQAVDAALALAAAESAAA